MYIIEPYYFNKDPKNRVDFARALKITALVIASWCDWYEAKLLMPMKNIRETERNGMLPEDPAEKRRFVEGLINWILSNSQNQELFALYLDSNPIKENHKFQHHDDTCCWYLYISPEEFRKLQAAWQENGLPEDLFYPAKNSLRLLKPLGAFGKFMTSLGLTWQSFELFSPKMWEEELKKNPESIKKLSRHIPL